MIQIIRCPQIVETKTINEQTQFASNDMLFEFENVYVNENTHTCRNLNNSHKDTENTSYILGIRLGPQIVRSSKKVQTRGIDVPLVVSNKKGIG